MLRCNCRFGQARRGTEPDHTLKTETDSEEFTVSSLDLKQVVPPKTVQIRAYRAVKYYYYRAWSIS